MAREGAWRPGEGIAFPYRSPHCAGAWLIFLEQVEMHCAVMGSHTSWAGGLRVALECWLCCHGSRKRLFGVKRHQFLPPHSPAAGSSGSVMPGPHCRKLMSRHHRAGGTQNGQHTAGSRVPCHDLLSPHSKGIVVNALHKLYRFNYFCVYTLEALNTFTL